MNGREAAKRRGRRSSRAPAAVALIAHDLRAALGALQLAFELERTARTAEKLSNPSDIAVDGALAWMARLIDDLVITAALDEGSLRLETNAVAPAALIRDAMASVQLLVPVGSVLVTCGADLPDVEADQHRMTQVFANLLSNAARAAPVGSMIALRVTRERSGVRFAITDDGPGLPRSAAALLRGGQLRLATGAQHGLGLLIARELIASHGGAVRVGRAGSGAATVSFTLPFAEA